MPTSSSPRRLLGALLLALHLLVIASLAVAQEQENVLDKIRTFQAILRLVRTNYVDEVDTNSLIDGAISGLLRELDPHSDYIDPERFRVMNERNRGEYHGIGISFAIRDGYLTVIAPIEGSPSARLGIRAGDRIVEIEGESAIDITESEVFERLRGPKGSHVRVGVQRAGHDELIEFDIERDRIPIMSIPYWFMIDDTTGYVRIIRFSATTSDELEVALDELERDGMQQLLLDLRGNAGGYLEQAIEVSDRFIPGGKMVVYTKGRIPGSSEEHYASEVNTHPIQPLVVLIDHGSASASEIVSGAIQDWDRGLVVGQTSFGKGLVQRQYRLQDGSALFLTVARYYTPSGRLIQRDYTDADKVSYYAEGYDDVDPNAEVDPDAADRPVFMTAGGRPVYGGGGITPDIALEPVAFTTTQQTLEQSGLFFEFANQWVGDTGFTYPDFESFRTGFEIDEATWERFVAAVDEHDVEIDREALATERDYIETGIKREIAGNLWGARERYRIIIDRDPTVAAAAGHLAEAASVLTAFHATNRGDRSEKH
ncbi:MAG: S41 family peptidase [Candidatus Eiseniibacteriota bacterium]